MTTHAMTGESENITVPRPALIGAAALIVISIVLAGVARLTGSWHVDPGTSAVVATREIRFTEEAGGIVVVADPATGQVLARYADGQGGFVRGSLRGLAFDRQRVGVGLSDAPYRLTRYASGRVTLVDPVTGITMDLNAFGESNRTAFERLLP